MKNTANALRVLDNTTKTYHYALSNAFKHQHKTMFSTEAMAEKFMQTYGDEIFSENGYKPIRSYYNKDNYSWEVTSHALDIKDRYLSYIEENNINLHLPHNCTDLQKEKAVFKRLMFDIDSLALLIADLVFSGEFDKVGALNEKLLEYMSLARTYEDERAHRDHVQKFQKFVFCLDNEDPDVCRLGEFEAYFLKKKEAYLQSFKSADNTGDKAQKTSIKNLKKIFHLVHCFKEAVKDADIKSARSFYDKAVQLLQEERDYGRCTYKLKQAELALAECQLPDNQLSA